MAGGYYGADVAQLRVLGERFDRSADEIERAGRALAHGITTTTQWQGPDASTFRGDWSGSHHPQLGAAVAALREAARQVRLNADQQQQASSADGGLLASIPVAAPAASRSVRSVRAFESRTGFGVSRSAGLVARAGRSDDFEATYASDGDEIRYTTKDFLSLGTGDVFKALGFVAAVKGLEASPFSFDLGISAEKGTQFIWVPQPGGTDNELRGLNGIPIRQVSGANFVTGYDADEVLHDIAQGNLAEPDAIAHVSGLKTFAAAQIEGGGSVFGQSGEVAVERSVEHWRDGRTVDVYTLSGTAGGEAGAHLDGKALGASIDLKAVAGTDASVQVATSYGPDGRAQTLQYTIVGHAEAGVEGSLNVAGGGAYERETQGLLVERTLTFDLSDPRVARTVAGEGTTGLVAHADWASEEVKVFRSATSASGADAIVFEAGAESSSIELVASGSRQPAADPSARMIDGYNGWRSQVVQNPDGTSSVFWSGEF